MSSSRSSQQSDCIKMPYQALLQDDRSVFSDISLTSDPVLEGYTSHFPSRSSHLLLSPAMQVALRSQRRGSFHSSMQYTNKPSFDANPAKYPHRLSMTSSNSSFSFIDEDSDEEDEEKAQEIDFKISPYQEDTGSSSLDRLIRDLEEYQIISSSNHDETSPPAPPQCDPPRRHSDPDVSTEFEKGLLDYLGADKKALRSSHEHLQIAIADLGSPRDVVEIDYEIARYAGLDSPYCPYDDGLLEGYGADSEDEEECVSISPSQYRIGTRMHSRCSLNAPTLLPRRTSLSAAAPQPRRGSFATKDKGKKPEMQIGLGSAPAEARQLSLADGQILRPRRVTISESKVEEWGDPYARKREFQKQRFHFSPRVMQRSRAATVGNQMRPYASDSESEGEATKRHAVNSWRKKSIVSPAPRRLASIAFVKRRVPAATSHASPILRSFSHAPSILQRGNHEKKSVSPSEWMSARPVLLPTRKRSRNVSAPILQHDDEISPKSRTRACSSRIQLPSQQSFNLAGSPNLNRAGSAAEIGLGLSIAHADDDDRVLFSSSP